MEIVSYRNYSYLPQLTPIRRTPAKTVSTELYKKFIDYLDTTPKTLDTYKKALKQFFNFIASKGINKPTRQDILVYKESLTAAGKKPATIQIYITVVKLFFSWTSQEGLYNNIADHVKGAKISKEHKKDYLTSQQIKTVLTGIEQGTIQGKRDRAIILLMVTGGLRDIEISRANIEDLGTAGDNTVLYIQGKGKTEKADYIKISQPVEKALREYLSFRGETKGTEPLFISTSNNSYGKRLTTRSISGLVKTRLINAGYKSERLTAHSLRHSAVTLALLSGQSITEVQQFARHSNINTTMIYNHALDKEKNSCSESISNIIF